MKNWSWILVLGALFLLWKWTGFTGADIHSDLRNYAKIIRLSSLPVEDKIRVLDQIQELDDYFEVQSPVSKSIWKDFDSVARELLKGTLDRDRLILLQREIGRFEKKLRERE